jgi:hypothetical protein
MAILRHSQVAVTMNVDSEVSSPATRKALRRLGVELKVLELKGFEPLAPRCELPAGWSFTVVRASASYG